MTENWQDKTVLVSGVCGSVGRELLGQLVALGPGRVIGFDNNESDLFFLREEYGEHGNVELYVGDVRDRGRVDSLMRGIDIVLHLAALKHVILSEHSPGDAVQTNILGTQNIIEAAQAATVERVLLTSSDKAVNPTNVMGTSKLMAERLMSAANARRGNGGPIFASTRFGNVLGSRGSVIPLFKGQIARGGPVTLTDRRMSRFIMTLSQAVRLVLESVFLAHGGEVFVTKMPIVRIHDLAEVMVEELAPGHGQPSGAIKLATIGAKAGEKLYEELLNDEEVRRTIELDRYFVVVPAFKALYEDIDYVYPEMVERRVDRPYNSSVEPAMAREALRHYLRRNHLLEDIGDRLCA